MLPLLRALLRSTRGVLRLARPTQGSMPESPQAFLDALAPWVSPMDLPTLLRQPFTRFAHLALTPHGDDEDVSVALSVEGQVLCRTWLRQRGLDPVGCSASGDSQRPIAPLVSARAVTPTRRGHHATSRQRQARRHRRGGLTVCRVPPVRCALCTTHPRWRALNRDFRACQHRLLLWLFGGVTLITPCVDHFELRQEEALGERGDAGDQLRGHRHPSLAGHGPTPLMRAARVERHSLPRRGTRLA